MRVIVKIQDFIMNELNKRRKAILTSCPSFLELLTKFVSNNDRTALKEIVKVKEAYTYINNPLYRGFSFNKITMRTFVVNLNRGMLLGSRHGHYYTKPNEFSTKGFSSWTSIQKIAESFAYRYWGSNKKPIPKPGLVMQLQYSGKVLNIRYLVMLFRDYLHKHDVCRFADAEYEFILPPMNLKSEEPVSTDIKEIKRIGTIIVNRV